MAQFLSLILLIELVQVGFCYFLVCFDSILFLGSFGFGLVPVHLEFCVFVVLNHCLGYILLVETIFSVI